MNNELITKEQLRDKILKNEDISGIDYSHITDMSKMFFGCSGLVEVPKLDTSKVTDMDYMFKECKSLKTIPELDTSKVKTMHGMFHLCSSLKYIPDMNTSKVTDMTYMFFNCTSLESIPDFDTSKAKDKDMAGMFKGTIFEKIPKIVMDKVKGTKNFRKNLEAMIKLYKD
jgi:surface protein